MLLFAGGYFWFGMSSSCTRVSRQPFDLNNQLKVIVISHQAPFHICISRNVRPASGSQQTHRFLHLEEARLLPLPIHFFLLNNLLPLNNRALLSMTILLAPSLLPLPLRILILLSLLPRPRCLSSPIAIIPGSLLGCPRCLRTRRSLLTIRRKSSIPTRIKVTFCQSICFFFCFIELFRRVLREQGESEEKPRQDNVLNPQFILRDAQQFARGCRGGEVGEGREFGVVDLLILDSVLGRGNGLIRLINEPWVRCRSIATILLGLTLACVYMTGRSDEGKSLGGWAVKVGLSPNHFADSPTECRHIGREELTAMARYSICFAERGMVDSLLGER